MHTIAILSSLLLGSASAAPELWIVTPTEETAPVPMANADAADDPAIWVNHEDPARSLVLGTDKKSGLCVFELDGTMRRFVDAGAVNNVDIRQHARLGGRDIDLVVATRIEDDSIVLFEILGEQRHLRRLAPVLPTGLEKVYGICLALDAQRTPHVFVSTKGGELRQWRLEMRGDRVHGVSVRTVTVGGKTEGLVADDDAGFLYVGEEENAIWRYQIDPATGSSRSMVDSLRPDGPLTGDIEGLAIYRLNDSEGYLIASSQGSDRFVVYERSGTNAHVGAFQIGAGAGIDGVTHTDGIEVTSLPVGDRYPSGLFIAQDDENPGAAQNFKLVGWDAIVRASGGVLKARRGDETTEN